MRKSDKDIDRAIRWRKDWNFFIRDATTIRLDRKQREILSSLQFNENTSIRSCNSRGKDFVFACAGICRIYLVPTDVKVILTAPTGRQAYKIMMAELRKVLSTFKIPLDGRLMADGIKFYDKNGEERGDKFLISFKAGDKALDAWNGFHSLHTMILMTEATGIVQEIFDAAKGCLMGSEDPRLGLAFNPFQRTGESYRSTYSEEYVHFSLSALTSPNVRSKKMLIPGQTDYRAVENAVNTEGWVQSITKEEFKPDLFDFKFEGQYYRPKDQFRIRILGEYPIESSDCLIPLEWLEASHRRWNKQRKVEDPKRITLDVAGMGRDKNVMAWGSEKHISFKSLNLPKTKKIHMQAAGILKGMLNENNIGIIDVVGEGAGTQSRLAEQGMKNVYGFKGNYTKAVKGIKDYYGNFSFVDMNSFTAWRLREALNPEIGINLALQPDKELDEEILNLKYEYRSNATIIVLPDKKEMKKIINRSPDKFDAVKMIFTPIRIRDKKEITAEELGIF